MVDYVRILDFGLAELKDGPALTVGMAVGTPSYMAPEQTLGEGTSDARTDLYTVGILLFEMLTQRKPFSSDKTANLILMQRHEPPPRLNALAGQASFSDELEAVVAKALAKAPADRFASAKEMAAALEEVPESAASAIPVMVPAAHESSRRVITAAAKPISAPLLEDTSPAADEPDRPVPEQRNPRFPTWRRWLWAVTSATAVLAVIFTWALWRRHTKAPRIQALPVPPVAVAPPPTAPDELAPLSPDDTPGLAGAAQLLRLGLRDQAITVLVDIRYRYPHSAYANFLLAVAYCERLFWSPALLHTQAAIKADPSYRRSPKLVKSVIRALVNDNVWEKAAAILQHELAEIATPYLEEAAQFDKSPKVRARAAHLLRP